MQKKKNPGKYDPCTERKQTRVRSRDDRYQNLCRGIIRIIINLFKTLKENIVKMSEQIENLSREMATLKRMRWKF